MKAINYADLMERVGAVGLSGVRAIAMDEFAIQRGHRYATVALEVGTNRVLSFALRSSSQRINSSGSLHAT